MTTTKVMPTTISMSAKCSDLFNAAFLDKDGNELFEYNGCVPDFFPDQHWGDYVMLDIELATGKIVNWKAPTQGQIDEMKADENK